MNNTAHQTLFPKGKKKENVPAWLAAITVTIAILLMWANFSAKHGGYGYGVTYPTKVEAKP